MVFLVALGCAAPAGTDIAERVEPFLEAVSARPEFVGAGFVDDGRQFVIAYVGEADSLRELAAELLPAGLPTDWRLVRWTLADLEAKAATIVAEELGRNPAVTKVGVDRLRGIVVIGVTDPDSAAARGLKATYGEIVVVEYFERIVPLAMSSTSALRSPPPSEARRAMST